MDNSNLFCDDSNSSWNNLKSTFTASRSPEIVPGVSDTEAAKAATGKAAAESMAMLPVDEDEELETAYDTVMLECQRVAVRIARAWPTGTGNPGGWTTLFPLLPADKEDRAWKWKLKWAQRQLDNLKGIENDAAASHSAMGQTAASNASAGRVAAGAEAAAATHSAMGQAAASNAGACREAAGAEGSGSGTTSSRTFGKRSSRHRKQLTMASTHGR